MNTAIGQIDSSAQEVRRICKTIEEIAFQTNILALNAAVEAARAGQTEPLSAWLVANEVRNLAQRESQSAGETAGLIGSSLASSTNGAATGTN